MRFALQQGQFGRRRVGDGGGGAAHRYYRLILGDVPGDPLELSELRLYTAGVLADAGATLTVSASFSFGSAANWKDGNLSNRASITAGNIEDPGTFIRWDFGTPTVINGLAQGGFDTATRYLRGFTFQHSDDNSIWTTQSVKSGLTYPGNATLSSIYDVSI